MTAFEPPDFTYFTGLQFNPEIYENTLTESVTLPPNPTFTSVSTTNLFTNNIQRLTAGIVNLFNSPAVSALFLGGLATQINLGNLLITGSSIVGNGTTEIGFGDGSIDAVVSALTLFLLGATAIQLQTPLFKLIQGATTMIECTETNFRMRSADGWSARAPLTQLGDGIGGTQWYSQSTFTHIINAGKIALFTPNINLQAFSASNIVNLNFNSSFVNDSVIASSLVATGGTATALQGTLTASAAVFRVNSTNFTCNSAPSAAPFDFNFFTSTTNPTIQSANIEVSGGTATANQGTITIASNITNLNSTNTICNGALNCNSDANFAGTNIFALTSSIRVSAVSGTYPLYSNAPQVILRNVAGGATVLLPAWNGIQYDSVFYFGSACTGTNALTLSNTLRIGNKCRVMNLGTGAVNISIAAGTARIFGDNISRGGIITFGLAAQQGCSITCVDGDGITAIGGNNYFIGAF